MSSYQYKQTFFTFILCTAVVGGFAYYIYGAKNADLLPGNNNDQTAASIEVAPIVSNEDWKRQFLNTESKNTGYGTTEVSTNSSARTEKRELTSTETLGQNFLTQYLALKQTGLNSDAEVVASAMDRVVSNSTMNLATIRFYSLGDLRIFDDTATMRAEYKNVLLSAKNLYEKRTDEAEIALNALETQNMDKLKELDAVIANYKNIVHILVSGSVPRKLSQYHLDLINNIVVLQSSAEAFKKFDVDPLKGMALIRDNAVATLNADDLFVGLETYVNTVSVAQTQ